jgi:hypothetical protein
MDALEPKSAFLGVGKPPPNRVVRDGRLATAEKFRFTMSNTALLQVHASGEKDKWRAPSAETPEEQKPVAEGLGAAKTDGDFAREGCRIRDGERASKLRHADFGGPLPAPAPPAERLHTIIDKLGGVCGEAVPLTLRSPPMRKRLSTCGTAQQAAILARFGLFRPVDGIHNHIDTMAPGAALLRLMHPVDSGVDTEREAELVA